MNSSFSISVRSLAETAAQKGDIDSRYTSSTRMQEGTAVHKKLQSLYSSKDLKELTISGVYENDGITLNVSGRIDGVLSYESHPVIDEIKSTSLNTELIEYPLEEHLAQAKIYAYLYLQEFTPPDIAVQIRYYGISDKSIKVFSFRCTEDELRSYFYGICEKYFVYLRLKASQTDRRDTSIDSMEFPFSYRKFQRELIFRIYSIQNEEKNLFLSAPTGTGKTINALFPSLKNISGGSESKIFYLTAKSTQKQAAQDALQLLAENGLDIVSVQITAKEKCCMLDEPSCSPDDCPYARDYYTKLFDIIKNLIENFRIITPENIKQIAEEHTVCPFELSLDTALWADVIICDYNYVFDPFVSLKRFFDVPGKNKTHFFLIDEAHNLADRSRDMYTARISKTEILALKKLLKNEKKLSKDLFKINKELLSCKKSEAPFPASELQPEIIYALYSYISDSDLFLTREKDHPAYNDAFSIFLVIKRFLRIYEERNDSHQVFFDKEKNELVIYCCDAKNYLSERINTARSSLFFSATLTPLPYFCEVLGGDKTDYLLNAPSIFDPGRFQILTDLSVSTTYAQREMHYGSIASRIKSIISKRLGNSIVFFPSYAFLNSVFSAQAAFFEESGVTVQTKNMSEEDRKEFIALFEPDAGITAFAVAGGVFSEAIDLIGEKLSAVVICGVSLPQICTERELIRAYFDKENKNGFSYAYLYAGMNKVLQAMGRVIRTEQDSGYAFLLDRRFGTEAYKNCFPAHYAHMRFSSDDDFDAALDEVTSQDTHRI